MTAKFHRISHIVTAFLPTPLFVRRRAHGAAARCFCAQAAELRAGSVVLPDIAPFQCRLTSFTSQAPLFNTPNLARHLALWQVRRLLPH